MNLFEIKEPLKIIPPDRGERLIAELFRSINGIYFVDIGWTDASWHPIHYVEGRISEKDPESKTWMINGHKISVIKKEDPLYGQYQQWLQMAKETNATREKAMEAIIADFDLDDEEYIFLRRNNYI